MKGLLQPRRLLAVCLSLLLVLAMIPAAFAEGETKAAKIGETEYDTLQEALNADAANNATVTLLKDVTENVVIASGKTITLELNGFVLNGGTVKSEAALTNNGTVTIQDSSQAQTGEIRREDNNPTGAYYTIYNEGTMTILSGKVYNNSGPITGSSLICNGAKKAATLEIKGGTLRQDNFIAVKNDEKGTLTITGGTIISNEQSVQNWQTAEISGGDLTGMVTSCAYLNVKGETTISGDVTVNGDVAAYWYAEGSPYPATVAPVVKVEGGTINGELKKQTTTTGSNPQVEDITAEGGDIEVSSGTFSAPVPSVLIKEDKAAASLNSTFYVGEPDEVVSKLAGANAGDVITIAQGNVALENVAGGVKVENKGEGSVTVNGNTVAKDAEVTIPQPKPPYSEPDYYPDYDEDVDYVKPEQPEVDGEKSYTVVCRTLNVRSGAGTTFAKIGALSRGTLVKGVEKNGWVQFTFNGTTAYVSAAYVQETGAASSNLSVICRTLNVRSGAGTSFGKIGTLSRGTGIDVVDTENGWYKIAFNGGYGYVSSAYIG